MTHDNDAIAVVGLACRFPGCDDAEAFWDLIVSGRDAVTRAPATYPRSPDLAAGRERSFARGRLTDVDAFDAAFFGVSPREAALMDPQQRLFLECAFHALEDAGYADDAGGPLDAALYVGCGVPTYMPVGHRLLRNAAERFAGLVANIPESTAMRASYKLKLSGESVAVQTACSSSLVAIHLACEALRAGGVRMALAGGVNLSLLPETEAQEGMIYSLTGVCRAFDAAADGTVEGDGVGVVVLKRLADARADGDRIHAVVRASAVNNDAHLKAGFTAPSAEGQAAVIRKAQARFAVAPATIGYVEAHGTGTAVGDPIEFEALSETFATPGRSAWCSLGTVKANIGHTTYAAGVAGFIKCVLAVQRGVRPPLAHFSAPNEAMEVDGSPFFFAKSAAPWATEGGAARRAAVSSFGIGGTNAHCVLEQAPAEAGAAGAQSAPLVFCVSGATDQALARQRARLAAWLRANPAAPLADVAYTLAAGRRQLPKRFACEANEARELAARLDGNEPPFAGPTPPAATAWLAGGRAITARGAGARGCIVSLPGYAFEKEQHWLTAEGLGAQAEGAATAAAAPQPAAAPAKTESTMLATILRLVEDAIGAKDVDPAQSLIEAGADSLNLAVLIDEVREATGVKFTVDEMFAFDSIAELAASCAKRSA